MFIAKQGNMAHIYQRFKDQATRKALCHWTTKTLYLGKKQQDSAVAENLHAATISNETTLTPEKEARAQEGR
ncbi:Uncharacterized protein HZ326_3916 [Fusarium oxysporum f. sp. albedinis]|nr:Uncharacterized protein HZ326_3916 [Fusarium oxysporum f. sp. albedinis]